MTQRHNIGKNFMCQIFSAWLQKLSSEKKKAAGTVTPSVKPGGIYMGKSPAERRRARLLLWQLVVLLQAARGPASAGPWCPPSRKSAMCRQTLPFLLHRDGMGSRLFRPRIILMYLAALQHPALIRPEKRCAKPHRWTKARASEP